MRVAVVHEWLVTFAGSERVIKAIFEIFPQADLFILIYDRRIKEKYFPDIKITASPLQKLPFGKKYFRLFLPKFPEYVEEFDLSEYDLVISSNHCVAKGVITGPSQVHVCYCHTPMRYAWELWKDYLDSLRFPLSIFKKTILKSLHFLRLWDVVSASRVDHFIANSSFIAKRIKKFYRREATVIHPPVDVDTIKNYAKGERKEKFFLTVSRLVPYKRVDLIIEAFNKLRLPLLVVGRGPDLRRLKNMAARNITFVEDYLEEKELCKLYAKARAFIYAGVEDFGMAMVEALAAGTPVIAFAQGGALDIVDKKSGLLFSKQSVDSIIDTVSKFLKNEQDFVRADLIKKASKFDKKVFKNKFMNFLKKLNMLP